VWLTSYVISSGNQTVSYVAGGVGDLAIHSPKQSLTVLEEVDEEMA